jgi:hypothetical protein
MMLRKKLKELMEHRKSGSDARQSTTAAILGLSYAASNIFSGSDVTKSILGFVLLAIALAMFSR